MKVLELFAGSRSIGKVAEKMGFEVFSVDIESYENIDLVKDINTLEISDIPFTPDVIVAGTPCTTYSLAAISHHRNEDYTPKTDFSLFCDNMNVHLLELLDQWLKINPNLCWYIENPRAVLRKMWFMKGLPRQTVWYCQYGDKRRAKPTDFWSNNFYSLFNPNGWQPRAECWNGRKDCHELAPRGSSTGTQGIKDAYERSTYPVELCEEILISTAQKLGYL